MRQVAARKSGEPEEYSRRALEEQLAESSLRYQELADILPRIFFETDELGTITFANRNALNSLGYGKEDIASGVSIFQIMFLEDQDTQECFRRVLSGENLPSIEYTARKKDGDTFPIQAYLSPIIRENRPVGVRGIAVDIRKRTHMEIALSESEIRYHDIFSNASDAIVIRDLTGNIVEVNQAMASLTGYTVDELAKMNVADILTKESFKIALEKQRQQLKGENPSQRYELEFVNKDGAKSVGESVTRLITHKGRPVGVQAIVRDITEQKRLSQNMQSYIREITRAQEEERKRIARELHDDLAQSLAALCLEIDSMRSQPDRLTGKVIWNLADLRGKVGTIMDLVRRFSQELRPGDLDVVGLVPTLERLTKELNSEGKTCARLKVVGAECRLPAETELALFRITQEALRNVRKHAQATEVMVRIAFAHNRIKLEVIDNGVGCDLPRTLGELAGKGKLGLIGMSERASLLHGSFSIKSRSEQGTTITAELPRPSHCS